VSWDSKRGAVLAAIVAKLQAMTLVGGYHFDVKAGSVVTDLTNIITVSETELPFFMAEFGKGSREFDSAREIQEWFPVLITARAIANGLDVHRKTQLSEYLVMDIEKALTTDITLGGKLFDLRIQAPDAPMMGLGNNNNVIVLVDVQCHLFRTYGAP
jgi:hypothetical protein